MSGELNHVALTAALTALQGKALAGLAVHDSLMNVVHGVIELFGVQGSGVMLVDASDALRYVAASDERGRRLEEAQEELGYGPCVDSLLYDEPYETTDLLEDPRWPGLAERVVPVGVRAVLGVPVKLGGVVVGSLNAFHERPHHWTVDERTGLRAFNRVVETVLTQAVLTHAQEQIVGQLEYALENRVVIERAIGVLMGRRGVDAVVAFNRLREYARSRRMRVADAAAQLLDGAIADL